MMFVTSSPGMKIASLPGMKIASLKVCVGSQVSASVP
jgi:hypothetical protein